MGIKNSTLVAEHTIFNNSIFYGLLDVDFAWIVAMNFIIFFKYLLTKTSKKQSCDVFGLFLLGGGMLGLVIISQRDRIEQYQSNKYGSLCSSSSIRILSIQTGVHMMERLVMRWRWYWTLTSSILLLFAFNEYYYLYIQVITT